MKNILRFALLIASASPALAFRDLETGAFISSDPAATELMNPDDVWIVNGQKFEAKPAQVNDTMSIAAIMNNHDNRINPSQTAQTEADRRYAELMQAQFGKSEGAFITIIHQVKPPQPNLYAYVNQNPWTMFDPEGLYPVENNGSGAAYIHMYNGNISKPSEVGSFVFNPNPKWSRQCATGAQFLAGSKLNQKTHDVPSTITWTKGDAVDGNKDLKPGTVIAKGWDSKGGYVNKSEIENAGNHTGIYVGQDKNNVYVYDQFNRDNGSYNIRAWPKKGSDWSVVTTPEKTDRKPSQSYVGEKGQKKPRE